MEGSLCSIIIILTNPTTIETWFLTSNAVASSSVWICCSSTPRRHSCQEVHHLTIYRRYLKAGSMFSLSGFDVSLVNRTGFPKSRRTLKVSKSKSAAWPSQHKYPASRSTLMLLETLTTLLICRRLFLNATSGRQLYFDKETNAEETYFTKVEFVCPMKVTGFNMDKGWCYVSCSRCTKKLQRTVSSFTWQPAVTPMQLVSFDMLDPKMSLFVDFNGKVHILAGEGENPEDTQLPLLLHK
ncbi:hypothetical protein HID58_018539 [Brassica napus]|uniref:Uncharacterized protein n=1 Tax=Brassica napus TaxID=3708 RepID=A0ABQ8DAP6_BRANA|nr:hypothetical protein HID58_018539 [Brassica napus]